MEKQYYSNGKLLITGEYAVLDGAQSLALPTTYGQSLKTITIAGSRILWKSYANTGEVWFETSFSIDEIKEYNTQEKEIPKTKETTVRETLLHILSTSHHLNPDFLSKPEGLLVENHLNFPRDWGLGTSSTLINNIAQWAQVDAFKLLWEAFTGSGYDIACAQHDTPILYQLNKDKPVVEEVIFDPPFKDQIYFVHLNQKQNSREGIAQYRKMTFDLQHLISMVGQITNKLLKCQELQEFNLLMDEHEQLIAATLQMETVKSRLFPDFPGSIKSLGAWGGDFIMATGSLKTNSYFNKKGFHTVIPYSEMVL